MTLPSVGIRIGLPKLVRSISQSRTGNRLLSVVEYADPFWQIDIETAALYWPEKMLMRAFEAEYGGGTKTVRYTVPGRMAVPQAYWDDPSSPIPADNGNLVSITDGSSLAVNSVTNGLQIMKGDLLSLATGDYRSLHMAKADAVASGGAISLSVEPFVPGYILTGAVVRFVSPELNTRVVYGSIKIDDEYVSPVSFTLVEVPK